jgi:hypothetical protein
MKRTGILIACLLSLGVAEMAAQSFSFFSTLQAGRQNSTDWEIGIGSGATPTVTSDYGYNVSGTQYWRGTGLTHDFEIGWDATTNSGYTTVFKADGTRTTVTLQNTGVALSANTIWTLPAGSFVAEATPNGGSSATTSIQLSNLSLTPGVSLAGGTLPSTFGASQSGTATSNNLGAPLLLDASANGGSWYISGTVQFSGLITQGGNARGNQLQFFLQAVGTDTPEASSLALMGGGLIALGMFNRSRRNGRRK